MKYKLLHLRQLLLPFDNRLGRRLGRLVRLLLLLLLLLATGKERNGGKSENRDGLHVFVLIFG